MKRTRDQSMASALTSLYAYIYCMMASQALTAMPLYGGALFMCGRVATVFGRTYNARTQKYLPPAMRVLRWILLAALLMINLFVLVVYPWKLNSPHIWLLFSLVLTMLLRDAVCLKLVRLNVDGRLTEQRFTAYVFFWHGLMLAVCAATLLTQLAQPLAWSMLGGYLLCALASFHDLLKVRERFSDMQESNGDASELLGPVIRKANAFAVYERLTTLIMAAMEMTLVVMYTYLAATAEQMLMRMAVAVLTTLVCREGAERFLQWRHDRQKGDPTNLLLVGLGMWLVGLGRFSAMLAESVQDMAVTFVCLALCSVGCALCSACVSAMEHPMSAVAKFTAGHDVAGYRRMRASNRELATLLGQMLALAALTALCFLSGQELPRSFAELAARFRPVMVIPALLTVLLALLCVLRFPLSKRYLNKVMRLLHIRESGGENPALQMQLESVVIQRHTQPLFIRALMAVLRPLFRHELKDVEHVHPDESNPIVFLCNHGEVYGPVAGMLFCPVPVRPWSISDITADPLEVAEFSYKHTYSHIHWLGPLRWPVARLLGYVSVWGLQSLECVPVYRNKPRELMTTFRKSVEAMQAGDNLLIFPENPDADPDNRGYEHGRPGELFRGFPMLAQIYYSKTGKRCRFLPMLAHKGMRTISFGTEIVYDPDAVPIDERDRIVEEASRQIQALYEREEALYQLKKTK